MVGGEESQLHVRSKGDAVSIIHWLDGKIVGFPSFESLGGVEELFDRFGNGSGGMDDSVAHRVEQTLAGPVGQSAEMVEVAVADADSAHGRQGAMRSAAVERQPELRQQDQRSFAGAAAAAEFERAPRGVDLEDAEGQRLDSTRKKLAAEDPFERSMRRAQSLPALKLFSKV